MNKLMVGLSIVTIILLIISILTGCFVRISTTVLTQNGKYIGYSTRKSLKFPWEELKSYSELPIITDGVTIVPLGDFSIYYSIIGQGINTTIIEVVP